MTDEPITLADKRDVYNFRVGQPIVCRMTDDGQLVRLRGFRLLRHRLWRWLTKPFRVRFVVSAADVERGSITLREDRAWWRFLA